jgi:hypothetical protein
MRVAEKLDWKGLKFKKNVGNRKIMSDEFRYYDFPFPDAFPRVVRTLANR